MPTKTTTNDFRRAWTSAYYFGGTVDSFSGTSGQVRVNTRITGPNVPNWQAKIAKGQNVTTSLDGVRFSIPVRRPIDYKGIHTFQAGTKFRGDGFPTTLNFPGQIALPTTEATTKATIDFAKKFTSKTQRWSGGVFVGELRETAALLRNPVKSMYGLTSRLTRDLQRIARDLSRRRRRRTPAGYLFQFTRKEWAEAISGTWLAYQFGMKPLVNDANDAAKALRALASGRGYDIIKIVGDGQSQEIPLGDIVGSVFPGLGIPGLLVGTSRTRFISEVRFRGGWRSDHPTGEMPVPMTFGTSVLDIIPTAWELIPWSFLVDYFTNVGDVLDAYKLRFVHFAWLNRTVRNRRQAEMSDVRCAPISGNFYLTAKGGHQIVKTTQVTRIPVSSDAFSAGFHLEVPGMGSNKWLNISALATQILASRPNSFF